MAEIDWSANFLQINMMKSCFMYVFMCVCVLCYILIPSFDSESVGWNNEIKINFSFAKIVNEKDRLWEWQ